MSDISILDSGIFGRRSFHEESRHNESKILDYCGIILTIILCVRAFVPMP